MLIAEIQKNLKERMRVSIEEYYGHKFIDLRVYFEVENAQWKPTKKGIALNNESIDAVIEALQKASKKLEGIKAPGAKELKCPSRVGHTLGTEAK